MKGDTTLKILGELKGSTLGMADLMMIILSSPYGTSIKGFEYRLNKLQKERRKDEEKIKIEKQLKRRFLDVVYKLEKGGLIKKEQKNGNFLFRLTSGGDKRLKILKKRKENILPETSYESVESKNFTIAIFDIPEKERRKREWLRSALKNIGFNLIQKSVRMGKVKIPKEFLNDMRELRMINFVEIFEISKGGTLRQIN